MRNGMVCGIFLFATSLSSTFNTATATLAEAGAVVGELEYDRVLARSEPDETVPVRGVEHHTYICSACHVTERRVVFIKDGREADGPPIPMQEAPSIKRASIEQEEHVAAPGFLSRVMARIRGH
jgi:hypothetical protein